MKELILDKFNELKFNNLSLDDQIILVEYYFKIGDVVVFINDKFKYLIYEDFSTPTKGDIKVVGYVERGKIINLSVEVTSTDGGIIVTNIHPAFVKLCEKTLRIKKLNKILD